MAQGYVSSTAGAPSDAAQTYIDIASDSLDEGLAAVNEFIDEELATFRNAVDEAGIGLLSVIEPVVLSE